MFNKFKNALYGPRTDDDPTEGIDYDTDYEADYKLMVGKRIRGALTRSSSSRDELLSEVAKTRSSTDLVADMKPTNSGLQRVKSQMLRRSLTSRDGDARSLNMTASMKSPTVRGMQTRFPKHQYSRPKFLQLRTDDEINVSADHQIRPIILPRDASRLPWQSGYAECVNAGKSAKNEDQAVCYEDVVVGTNLESDGIKGQLPFIMFGLFDGHAGDAVAVTAAAELPAIISEKLRQVADILIALEFSHDDANNNGEGEPGDRDDDGSDPAGEASNSKTAVQNNDNEVSKPKAADPVSDDSDDITMETTQQQPRVPEGEGAARAASDEPQEAEEEKEEVLISKQEETHSNLNPTQGERAPTPVAAGGGGGMDNDLEDNSENHDQGAAPRLDGSVAGRAEPDPATAGQNHSSSDRKPDNAFLANVIDISRNNITVESLIKGALESAFWEMDEIIGRDKEYYRMPGGCAAIVSLFILGKLYVCNAGDSRAIVCKGNQVTPMSFDFTPTSERERILRLGRQRPELLGNDFTQLEFIRRPTRKDLGKRMLYRDAYMTGWSSKEISYDDLKFPLVYGEGKRSRLFACIGLSRGFGDHELRTQYGSLAIKPFLTPEPEVRVLDLESDAGLTNEDVLIQASDGLWDVATNQEISELVNRSLKIDNEVARSKYRYISVAQDLVGWSRGSTSKSCGWRMSDGRFASMDDISVFVVPLKQYRDEYLVWKQLRNEAPKPAGQHSRAPR